MTHIINKTGYMILLSAVLLGSCTKDFESLNTPPVNPTTAPTPQVYNAIVSSLPMVSGEYSVMNSWLYPITQQAIVTSGAYPYDNAKASVWQNYYQAMGDYRLLQDRIHQEKDTTIFNNVSAMMRTILAYSTFKVTNYFGDMPYTQAGYAPLKGSVGYKPVYDKQADVYAAMLSDLKWAVDNFSTNSNQYSVGAYETFLQNDITKWTQFANSLRLYIAVTMYDKNSTLAATHIAEALTKPLLADGNDIGLWPANISGLDFQWRQWSFSANCYLRMGSTMWGLMSSNNNKDGSGIFDIRAKLFYEPNGAGEWVAYPQNPTTSTPSEGGAPYSTDRFTTWSKKAGTNYSPVNLYFEQDTKSIPELMLTAAEVHLIKAEVYNRGLGVAANQTTAAAEYNAGIAASLNMWKSIAFNSPVWVVGKPASAAATSAEISAVVNNPLTKYDAGNAANALKQIYAQLWIDQFRQPFDAWTLQRRTGNMTPMSTTNPAYYTANFGTYQRFVYPDPELNYNFDNWKAATGGTDLNSNKIWIAK
ncbi:SusD/RagB family nutrient-binding outer membrane lipoprotein [Chitinophagaceae bacterium 26-R-25]|nr:SusD/RagB family nutrient-binding outer membrane lipoprotein [Chitinophagaceae bacterium 26-R-25]